MSQVLSLIQSMWNRANPLANPDKNADAKAATPNAQAPQKQQPSLDPFGLGSKPSVSPFQAKVQESHAKLAAKVTPPKHDQSRAQLINPAAPKPVAPPPHKDAKPEARASHEDHASRADKADRAPANDRAQGKGRKEKAAQAGQAKTGSKRDVDSRGQSEDGQNRNVKDTGNTAHSDSQNQDVRADAGAADAADGQAKEALQARLEKMGVTATDEQLNDPAFGRCSSWCKPPPPPPITPLRMGTRARIRRT